MKRKVSICSVLILTVLLMMTAISTATADSLSMQQLIEQEIVPMAQANDHGEAINDRFCSEE